MWKNVRGCHRIEDVKESDIIFFVVQKVETVDADILLHKRIVPPHLLAHKCEDHDSKPSMYTLSRWGSPHHIRTPAAATAVVLLGATGSTGSAAQRMLS